MKRHKLCAIYTVVFLVAFFALPGFVQTVMGQGCSSWMTPSYSTYASSTSDGTYVYTTVAVSGTAYGNCPVGCSCYGVTHDPGAYNVLGGSVGGMEYGARVPWNNYLDETNNQQVAAAPGTLVDFNYDGLVLCSVVGTIYHLGEQSTQVASFTHVQHTYPNEPFTKLCHTSQFFDSLNHGKLHHALDVVWDNGTKKGISPPYGTPVLAMEAGEVTYTQSGEPPAPEGYPACLGKGGHHATNYVKIKGADGYYTAYVHVTPTVTVNTPVTAGQEIGTLDNSGCQSGAHTHIKREDANGVVYNFRIPCTNPDPTTNFWDGTVDDWVDDNL
ncbi:MAG: M23 family metallopeptidase [Acidobacteriota bacterium]|nr:M23 family metallopeptidase [Acidobacteriota bacterium]